jgi:hypothetical protein
VDSSGFHRDSSWLHMEYLWIPVDSLGKTTFQCGLSMEIPYGMTSFLMESTGIHWNESGPSSWDTAKLARKYSLWTPVETSGMLWNSSGFHGNRWVSVKCSKIACN